MHVYHYKLLCFYLDQRTPLLLFDTLDVYSTFFSWSVITSPSWPMPSHIPSPFLALQAWKHISFFLDSIIFANCKASKTSSLFIAPYMSYLFAKISTGAFASSGSSITLCSSSHALIIFSLSPESTTNITALILSK